MNAESIVPVEVPEPESPLQQLPTTRRAILNLLKRQGPLDATAVAARWPSHPPPSGSS